MRWILLVILLLVGCAKVPTNPYPQVPYVGDCSVRGVWVSENVVLTLIGEDAYLNNNFLLIGNVSFSSGKYLVSVNGTSYSLKLTEDCLVLYNSKNTFYRRY
jgi:hypothetical protein